MPLSLAGNAVLLCRTGQPRGPEAPRGRGRAEVGQDSRIPRFGFRRAGGPNLQVSTKFLLPILSAWRLPSSCCLWLISSEKGSDKKLGGELEVSKDIFATHLPLMRAGAEGRFSLFMAPEAGQVGRRQSSSTCWEDGAEKR